jgi:hypothetical protein
MQLHCSTPVLVPLFITSSYKGSEPPLYIAVHVCSTHRPLHFSTHFLKLSSFPETKNGIATPKPNGTPRLIIQIGSSVSKKAKKKFLQEFLHKLKMSPYKLKRKTMAQHKSKWMCQGSPTD